MFKKIIAICLLATTLQGCLFAIGAAISASVIGAVVYDKRSAQTTEQDDKINTSIQDKLSNVPEITKGSHIVVATYNGVVLLAGQVPNKTLKDEAYAIAQTVPNIRQLYNEITVEGKPSTLTEINDSMINTKIKTKLIADKNLESSEIFVVTVDGTVYLMGSITKGHSDQAASIAQHVSGVTKVVKLFEYQSIDGPTATSSTSSTGDQYSDSNLEM
jgi:osmotically-inducible protein OsmY